MTDVTVRKENPAWDYDVCVNYTFPYLLSPWIEINLCFYFMINVAGKICESPFSLSHE